MNHLSDEDLHRALLAGERAAAAALYDRYFRRIRGFFGNRLADAAAWDDLTQQTFTIALFESPASFRGASSYRSWLFGIAFNLLRAHYRSQARIVLGHDESDEALEERPVVAMGVGISTLRARCADLQRLLDTLRRLPSALQHAFELYAWQGMSAREIGEVTGIPEGTARSRVRLAKERLGKLGVPEESLDELSRRARVEVIEEPEES